MYLFDTSFVIDLFRREETTVKLSGEQTGTLR